MQLTDYVKTEKFTESEILSSLIYYYLAEGSAIALWRKPNSNEKHLLISSNGAKEIEELSLEETETGFVFSPFDTRKKKVFFKGDLIYTFKNGQLEDTNPPEEILKKINLSTSGSLPQKKHLEPVLKTLHHNYAELVINCKAYIASGACEKIVPSRHKEVMLKDGFDCVKTFNELCSAYPNAFVSFVSSEETGTWIGATPELLVSLDDNARFKTVALAGTKRLNEGMDVKTVAWTGKEIEEQALVCRYIISCFKKIRLREYEERGPRTVIAGNVVHLKTEFEVDTIATNFPLLSSIMLKLLHPTSAVCGMPLEAAQQFLKMNEGYDREFYSGFLGPVNFKNESHLFVNLRCMQVLTKTAILYAGAGVTIDSDPLKEFEETELKMDALLNLIK